MKNVIPTLSCALALLASPLAAQTGAGSGSGSGRGAASNGDQATASSSSSQTTTTQKDGKSTTTTVKTEEMNPRFVRTLTNVQIELTLTDQSGAAVPDKKTVSMV